MICHLKRHKLEKSSSLSVTGCKKSNVSTVQLFDGGDFFDVRNEKRVAKTCDLSVACLILLGVGPITYVIPRGLAYFS